MYVKKAAEMMFVQKTRAYNVDEIDTWSLQYNCKTYRFYSCTRRPAYWFFRYHFRELSHVILVIRVRVELKNDNFLDLNMSIFGTFTEPEF